ncbi:MAG: hypothetical protein HY895_01915 [Deltaproteobacteria bacterium]|nr:hypothetical protein [Deltaproteobacteria bacterium]
MKSEIFNIDNHKLHCEIFESELKIDSMDSRTVLLLSFVFGKYYSDFLLGLGEHLWVSVAKRYLILKNEIAAKTSDEVIGRISFECDDTRVEYEFSRFTKNVLLTLFLIVPFVRQYPNSEEIRIAREGPILVRFRDPDVNNVSDVHAGKEAKFKEWFATVGENAKSFVMRRR